MCVIFICEEERPTEDMIKRAFERNPAGAGIAWRENIRYDEEKKPISGEVVWEKGLDLEEIQQYAATAPTPFIMHFRVPSCGGSYNTLCHPFPIKEDAPLSLSGRTDGYVLFHNGHWTKWKDMMLETAVRRSIRLPGGRWSDTRAMAVAAAYNGLAILEMVDEKTVAFSPIDCEVTGRFEKVAVGSGHIWCSNTYWQGGFGRDSWEGYNGYVGTMCIKGSCTKPRANGSQYCTEHLPKQESKEVTPEQTFRNGKTEVPAGGDRKEEVESGKKAVREGDGKTEEVKLDANDSISAKQKMRQWACSLNPKGFRIGTGRSLAAAHASDSDYSIIQ